MISNNTIYIGNLLIFISLGLIGIVILFWLKDIKEMLGEK